VSKYTQVGKRLPRCGCLECDGPDPMKTDNMKTDKVMGWLKGELRPPKCASGYSALGTRIQGTRTMFTFVHFSWNETRSPA